MARLWQWALLGVSIALLYHSWWQSWSWSRWQHWLHQPLQGTLFDAASSASSAADHLRHQLLLLMSATDLHHSTRSLLRVLALGGLLLALLPPLFAPLAVSAKRVLARSRRGPATSTKAVVARLPPPFPNGWFFVCHSSLVPVGDVRGVDMLGSRMVLFRGRESRQVSLLDAYCPHLGADLSVGGTVTEDCIECPFHGWRFDANGQCAGIPYSNTIPEVARTRAHHVCEVSGRIFTWHHAEGDQPWPLLEALPELNRMSTHGYIEHSVSCHVQEVLQQDWIDAPADSTGNRSGTAGFLPRIEHCWHATQPVSEQQHRATQPLRYSMRLRVLGTSWALMQAPAQAEQLGPGLAAIRITTALGRVMVLRSVSPIGPMLQKTVHSVWGERWVPRLLAKTLLRGVVAHFERKLPIWNNKIFAENSPLAQGEESLARFRAWFAQFCTPSSMTAETAAQTLDW